ncbi:PadR family transcriptional regulator [Sphingomonas sp. NIBR02145]|uniref:PadR family transcriptional regulator n=1 Tax=Sphingomonas sp. NIBR02145 TaxID=3014784 RepID=UPI0022B512D7|nr:PadR family transcriptional regulator [Sphingomonas sp. NIBR02145]WHU03680.1 PadR family transcriptional regulator [Sphingomonas sp. NIBR02145]
MVRNRALSPAARNVLAILLDAGADWSHGYSLGRAAGIKSGTLYPLLIRLEEKGHLEAQWQPPSEPGRPARHAYRLTAEGRAFAIELLRDGAPGLAENRA